MTDDQRATCTATILWGNRFTAAPTRCAQPASHYDGDRKPDTYTTPGDPGGWHRATDPDLVTWADWADGATPHTPAADEPTTDAAAALALLHEGEEPYEHEYTVATPAQWIWLWNRSTPERRLEVATEIMEACSQSDRCKFAGHEERLEQVGAALGANIRALAIVDDWLQHRAMRPETGRALSEVRAALTGEEQPGRWEWRGEHGPELVRLPRREPGAARAAIEAEYPDDTEPEPTLGFIVSDRFRWPALCDDEERKGRYQQLLAWLRANGIEPNDIPARSTVSIVPGPDGGEAIRHTVYLRSEGGHIQASPDGSVPVTEPRLVPMLAPLPWRTTPATPSDQEK
jgi:hypothetical protein